MFIVLFLPLNNSTLNAKNDYSSQIFNTSLIEHSPIVINSNNDFSTLGFDGNGSLSNPYIIENLQIDSEDISGSAIQIGGTTDYFVIRNCKLFSAYIGIFIQNTNAIGTAQIINNTINSSSGNGGGIGCGVGYTILENNTISGFMQGIHLNYASHCTIKGNNILLSYYQGINVRFSSFTEVTSNIIKNSNQHGLAIVGSLSSYNVIHHNIFINNSVELTYEIDGERTGEISSQGYDEGENNLWFDEENQHGNWWDDYNKKGVYNIDGPSDSIDEYPLKYAESNKTNFLISVSLITFIFIICLNKKNRIREINMEP